MFKKGNIPHNKGKTKQNYEPLARAGKNQSIIRKKLFKEGKLKVWNNGLTKDIDSRIKHGENHPLLGKHHSKEAKEKIGLANSGKHINVGKDNPMFGKKQTKEHIKKRTKKGEEHYNWQGGISFEPYDKSFNNKFKRAIRKRDNQICLKCGTHREKLKEALTVHHIDYNKKLSIPQNCCAVCRKCNSEVNSNREHWTKFFQSLLSERYGYQYSGEGEIILELNKSKNLK